eukprot:1146729-Pelagomonas_calceolata.AAC.2
MRPTCKETKEETTPVIRVPVHQESVPNCISFACRKRLCTTQPRWSCALLWPSSNGELLLSVCFWLCPWQAASGILFNLIRFISFTLVLGAAVRGAHRQRRSTTWLHTGNAQVGCALCVPCDGHRPLRYKVHTGSAQVRHPHGIVHNDTGKAAHVDKGYPLVNSVFYSPL